MKPGRKTLNLVGPGGVALIIRNTRLVKPPLRGDANAQYNLGVFYDNGLGVPQDKVRAYMWFSLSAAQGRDGAAAFRDLIARLMTPAHDTPQLSSIETDIKTIAAMHSQCPLWVKSRHMQCKKPCQLYPQ
jgi:TPR repeat protein